MWSFLVLHYPLYTPEGVSEQFILEAGFTLNFLRMPLVLTWQREDSAVCVWSDKGESSSSEKWHDESEMGR